MDPSDLHSEVQSAFNSGDVDALVSLYESDAWFVTIDGPVRGHDAIRAAWEGILAMSDHVEMVTQYAIENGNLALLSNRWTGAIGGETVSATTAEVARRQADGTWKYVIDNPDAAGILAG